VTALIAGLGFVPWAGGSAFMAGFNGFVCLEYVWEGGSLLLWLHWCRYIVWVCLYVFWREESFVMLCFSLCG